MTENLILEVGCDEIPARYLLNAIENFKLRAETALRDTRLPFDDLKTLGTPRRLILYVKGLGDRSSDTQTKVRGPSKKAAFDENGNPTKALLGFSRSIGIDPVSVTIETESGGQYVYGVKTEKGRPVDEVLGEILPDVVMKIECPYPLRWGEDNWRWFRPIRWVLCLYGSQIVPLSIAGKRSGRISFGHRTLHPGTVSVDRSDNYFTKIREAGVIVDPQERLNMIEEGQHLASNLQGKVVFDQDLVSELVSLSEHPAPFVGNFNEKYLALPEEVLITSMKHHQKSLPVRTNNGRLLPAFLAVRDGDGKHSIDKVRSGNEWILKARLEDAEFFYNQDLKMTLRDRLPMLKGVRFLKNAKTLFEKSQRMVHLAQELGKSLGFSDEDIQLARDAALLAKCDLVTSMVGEFPELEGIVGGIYAEKEGLNPKIASAIYQHYLPKGAKDKLPDEGIPSVVALSDKIDTLSMSFALGIEVRGSEDPFGLRRLAQGIVGIVNGHGYDDLDLSWVLDISMDLVEEELDAPTAHCRDRLWDFLVSRLEVYLSDLGYPTAIIRAVLGSEEKRVARLEKMAIALEKAISRQVASDIVTGWRRTSVLGASTDRRYIDEKLLMEESEKALYTLITEMAPEAQGMFEEKDYDGYLDLLVTLKEPIDRCLDEVHIMAKEEEIKANRLALLGMVSDLFRKMADFREILSLVG
jgi:glycyl-tRNA synthetase beta chain